MKLTEVRKIVKDQYQAPFNKKVTVVKRDGKIVIRRHEDSARHLEMNRGMFESSMQSLGFKGSAESVRGSKGLYTAWFIEFTVEE